MEVITALLQNPNSILTIIALLVAGFLGWLIYKFAVNELQSFKQTVQASATQVQISSDSFQKKFDGVNQKLLSHSSDMGKMTKAVQGEFLKIQEKIFDLKQELTSEVEKVKSLSTETTSSLKLAHEITKLSIEGMNEKLGKIIVIEKEVETFKMQVPKVQESVGQNKLEVTRNTNQIGELARLLKATNAKLERLESEIKKGPKNEV